MSSEHWFRGLHWAKWLHFSHNPHLLLRRRHQPPTLWLLHFALCISNAMLEKIWLKQWHTVLGGRGQRRSHCLTPFSWCQWLWLGTAGASQLSISQRRQPYILPRGRKSTFSPSAINNHSMVLCLVCCKHTVIHSLKPKRGWGKEMALLENY